LGTGEVWTIAKKMKFLALAFFIQGFFCTKKITSYWGSNPRPPSPWSNFYTGLNCIDFIGNALCCNFYQSRGTSRLLRNDRLFNEKRNKAHHLMLSSTTQNNRVMIQSLNHKPSTVHQPIIIKLLLFLWRKNHPSGLGSPIFEVSISHTI